MRENKDDVRRKEMAGKGVNAIVSSVRLSSHTHTHTSQSVSGKKIREMSDWKFSAKRCVVNTMYKSATKCYRKLYFLSSNTTRNEKKRKKEKNAKQKQNTKRREKAAASDFSFCFSFSLSNCIQCLRNQQQYNDGNLWKTKEKEITDCKIIMHYCGSYQISSRGYSTFLCHIILRFLHHFVHCLESEKNTHCTRFTSADTWDREWNAFTSCILRIPYFAEFRRVSKNLGTYLSNSKGPWIEFLGHPVYWTLLYRMRNANRWICIKLNVDSSLRVRIDHNWRCKFHSHLLTACQSSHLCNMCRHYQESRSHSISWPSGSIHTTYAHMIAVTWWQTEKVEIKSCARARSLRKTDTYKMKGKERKKTNIEQNTFVRWTTEERKKTCTFYVFRMVFYSVRFHCNAVECNPADVAAKENNSETNTRKMKRTKR